MANWANTNIMFFSKNKEQLEKLCKVIQDAPEIYESDLEEGLKRNSPGGWVIGNGWIGAILYSLKMITLEEAIEDKIPDHLSCRGMVSDQDYDIEEDMQPNPYLEDEKGYHFYIQTEDAWEPNVGTWDQILMEHFPDVKFVYVSEEGGNGYYQNSDEDRFYWKDDYFLDVSLDLETCSPRLKDIVKDGCPTFTEEYCSFEFDDLLEWFRDTFKVFENVETKEEFEATVAELTDMAEEGDDSGANWIRIYKYED